MELLAAIADVAETEEEIFAVIGRMFAQRRISLIVRHQAVAS